MSRPTDLRYNQSLPMKLPEPEIGNPIRRGDTVTNIDPLGNVIPAPGEVLETHGGYTVAPGLAAQAAKEAEGPKPGISDVIAEEAVPARYPDGCPAFRPLHRLGFKEKAEAFELYDVVQKTSKTIGSPKKGDELDAKRAANYYRLLAKIDEFLSFVAIDKEAYENWPGRTDETLFGQAWNAYQGDAQPGEAASLSN